MSFLQNPVVLAGATALGSHVTGTVTDAAVVTLTPAAGSRVALIYVDGAIVATVDGSTAPVKTPGSEVGFRLGSGFLGLLPCDGGTTIKILSLSGNVRYQVQYLV